MHSDPRMPMRRSQIYAVLNGSVTQPPPWPFVHALVLSCQQYAARHGNPLSVTTDLGIWRRDHAYLDELSQRSRQRDADPHDGAPADGRRAAVSRQEVHRYQVRALPAHRINIVTGDIRQVTGVDAWVNPENTEMVMARITDHSVSAVIRYAGAELDRAGRVVEDLVADDLEKTIGELRPVAPATVVVTSSGRLRDTHGVRKVLHVASAQGEPGAGYRPVAELGRCLLAVLQAAAAEDDGEVIGTVLVPIIGAGSARGAPAEIVPILVDVAADFLARQPPGPLREVNFSAYTQEEQAVCRAVLDAHPKLRRLDG
ncbi:macro domain-containing protein [Catellatospora methionotrophica]|uniref:macro domain-containing protein n=1 Tax=Catellatospora methionotrophica TaxID=121620 RepID=UPI0033F8FD0A